MEPVLNEQQSLFRDSAVRLCRTAGGPKRARALRNERIEWDREAWKEIAASGWLGAAVPEAAGGLGSGLFELSIAMEEAGKNLLAVPLVEAAAAVWAIGRSGADAKWLQSIMEGTRIVLPALSQEGWSGAVEQGLVLDANNRINGAVRFVPYAPAAQEFLVLAHAGAEPVLGVLPRDAVRLATVRNVDGSTSSELSCEGARMATVLARGETASRLAARIEEFLVLGASAQLVGVASAALDMTLEYIKVRQQFGKPLGSFQALQHRCADRFVDIELNRSLLYRVASAWDAEQAHPAMASAAKARSGRCALETTRTALQFHGAIGYTDEHDIGLFYKRAIVLGALYGNESNHTSRFSRLTVSDPLGEA